MIKYLKYMFMAAITLMAATSCQEDAEDALPKNPVAPVLTSNGSILMTQNTMSENIQWSWTAARNMQGEVDYALYARYMEETPVQLGTTTELNLSMSKTQFKTLTDGIASVPENASFDLSFYVTATDDNDTYTSDEVVITVYSYGDAVPATVTAEATEVVLDSENPEAELTLLSWEAARLNYNEAITYRLDATVGSTTATVASDMVETSYTTTVQAWNEFCVKTLGVPETQTSDVELTVYAFSESYPDGVPSQSVSIAVSTYGLPYPKEEYIYIPGNHQGWAPATAPRLRSVNMDGVYTGFCYLDGEFKFTAQPDWTPTEYNASHFPNKSDNLSGEGTGNLSIDQAGFYYIVADVMTGTLTATLTTTWGAIGDFNGWGDDADLTWDAEKGCWSGVVELTPGGMKFRANDAWDIRVGTALDNLEAGSNPANCTFEGTAGIYLIELYLQRTDSEQMYATLTPQ